MLRRVPLILVLVGLLIRLAVFVVEFGLRAVTDSIGLRYVIALMLCLAGLIALALRSGEQEQSV